jgi:O-antigen/teichoic acid export membrane protein
MEEHRLPTLRRNFSWTFAGNALYAAAQWGMLTALAKLGTPQMVGQFALGLAITAPVILFASLQLQTLQATDARDQYQFADYLSLRLITTMLALVVIVGIAYVAGYRLETKLVILLVGLAKAFEAMSDVFYGLFLRHERMERMAGSMIIKGLLSLAALSVGVYLTGSVVWGVVGMALAWALVLFGYDIRSGAWILNNFPETTANPGLKKGPASGLRLRWAPDRLASLAWLSLPLGFVIALISLKATIPRYFVEHFMGERELGIYAAMAYILVAGATVVQALGRSTSPRLARYYAEGDISRFRWLLLGAAGIGALLGVFGVLAALVAGREILTILYAPEYAENPDVFVWLMVAAGLNYVASFLGYGMTAARYLRAQAPLFALALCSVALACWWLVPAAGLRGAAMASIIGAVVQLCGSLAIIVHALRVREEKGGA